MLIEDRVLAFMYLHVRHGPYVVKGEYSTCCECGTKKKSPSLSGIGPMTSQTPGRGPYFIYFTLRTGVSKLQNVTLVKFSLTDNLK